jgi:hypothetical protein
MKRPSLLPQRISTTIVAATLTATFTAPSVLADNFVLTASDALAISSFNTGTNWSPATTAPAPGNTYQTAQFVLRTPQTAGDFVFAGDSLELSAVGGTLRHKTTGIITVNNLIVAEGGIVELTRPNAANLATSAGTLSGNILLNGTATFRGGIAGDNAGHVLTITSNITGVGGVTTTGQVGTVLLAGTNTYGGLTTVSAGSVLVTGSISGAVAVNTGVLAGSGSVGAVTVGANGVISPGATPTTVGNGLGTLSTQALSLTGTAQFRLGINTNTLQSDLTNVTGNFSLDLGGTTVLSLTDAGTNAALSAGTTFTLIDYSGAWNGGTFASRPDDSVFTLGANQYQISYNGLSGTDSAVVLTVVPEPTSATLLLASAGLFVGLRRRNRGLRRR